MKRSLILAVMVLVASIAGSCSKSGSEDQDLNKIDITGRWVNLSDENDVFIFGTDNSGSYSYRYIDSTDPATGVPTYFPTTGVSKYDFEYYTLDYNGEDYDLTFFGSPFPISNATVHFVNGYLWIKYDWADYRGKEWFDVKELYKREY